MNICVIPARGGSKRIPGKNIKKFCGRPIIAYSIDAAIKSGLFKRIIVSTDSNEISKIANKYGAETPFIRPEKLSDDFTHTHDVIGHAINYFEKNGNNINYVCCIYPTAPFIQINDLIRGLKLIESGKWDLILAATNYSYPIFRSFEYLSNGGLKMIFPEHFNSRSQDLPKIYHDTGQFYWAKPTTWKNEMKGFSIKNSIVKIPNFRAHDIDTIEDWQKAEIMFKILNKNNKLKKK